LALKSQALKMAWESGLSNQPSTIIFSLSACEWQIPNHGYGQNLLGRDSEMIQSIEQLAEPKLVMLLKETKETADSVFDLFRWEKRLKRRVKDECLRTRKSIGWLDKT